MSNTLSNKKVSEGRWKWTAVLVILNLTVIGTFALTYFYSEIFSWENTLPATLTYFSFYYFLLSEVWCRLGEKFVGPKECSTLSKSEVKSKWYVNFFSDELNAFFILFLINLAFAVISSLVWWICGAYEHHTLLESMKIGGIFGSLPFVFILILMGGG